MIRRILLVAALCVALTGCTIEDEIRFWFAARGASVEDQEKAVQVAHCESRLQPAAGAGDFRGLFQLSKRYQSHRMARLGFTWERMVEVGPNSQVAADLWAEQGWGPWSCAR